MATIGRRGDRQHRADRLDPILVALTAVPGEGLTFQGWTGGCGTSTNATITVTVGSANLECTATFSGGDPEPLTVSKSGSGSGTVSSSPGGISCGSTCSAEFAGWSGTGCTTSNSSVTVLVNQARTCTATFAAPPPPGCDAGEQSACEHDGGTWDSDLCECHYWSEDPLPIPLDGRPIRLTGVRNGVLFDVNGDGILDRVAWTVPGSQAGFLVLDRNGNGVVDGQDELLGQAVTGRRHPARLRQGYGDGLISAADAVFGQLRIWVDANHDGISQPGELLTLAQAGIASIELTAQPTGRRDRFGNYFRYRAVVHLANGHQTVVWDVFLAARPR